MELDRDQESRSPPLRWTLRRPSPRWWCPTASTSRTTPICSPRAPKIAHIDLIDEDLLAKDPARGGDPCIHQPRTTIPPEAIAFLREKLTAAGIGQSSLHRGSESRRSGPPPGSSTIIRCISAAGWWSARAGRAMSGLPDEVVLTLGPGYGLRYRQPRLPPGSAWSCSRSTVPRAGRCWMWAAAQRDPGHRARCCSAAITPTASRSTPPPCGSPRRNSAINHTGDRVTFHCGDLVEKGQRQL